MLTAAHGIRLSSIPRSTPSSRSPSRIVVAAASHGIQRRHELLWAAGIAGLAMVQPAQALGRSSGEDGLKIYEVKQGSGPLVSNGSVVVVHYDCKFRGLDVVSSRSARLLGGNRTLAEPFGFTAGEPLRSRAQQVSDRGGGGLFSGEGGPKPPPALSTAVIGMKKGGVRSVLVPPEVGYGSKGNLEIPPDTQFELQIEVLEVRQ